MGSHRSCWGKTWGRGELLAPRRDTSGEQAVLSLSRCRDLLGPRCRLSDEEVKALCRNLYTFAAVAIEAYADAKQPERRSACTDTTNSARDQAPSSKTPAPSETSHRLPDEVREELEERAAILEHEAGFDRTTAELRALAIWHGQKP